MAVRVNVSRALIVTSANNPLGSLGLYQHLDKLAAEGIAAAQRRAPVGNILDRLHDTRRAGTYRTSFGFDRVGGNQAVRRRRIINDAPHAQVVEKGRRPTFTFERFTTRHLGGGEFVAPFGTPKSRLRRSGLRVMEKSMKELARKHTYLKLTLGGRL